MSARKLWVVTGTTNPYKTERLWRSWGAKASAGTKTTGGLVSRAIMVWNGTGPRPYVVQGGTNLILIEDYLGVVPAFCLGLQAVIHRAQPHDVIACLHDDLEIFEQDWDLKVLEHFDAHPNTILAGFFGATGLGHPDIYKTPYDPMQLARMDCWSNMDDAEKHGQRSTEAKRVVCLDGFSQIMRADFAKYVCEQLQESKVIHHGYDSAIGCYAAEWAAAHAPTVHDEISWEPQGGEVWMIPISCHHAGGQTAVGDSGYQDWAKLQTKEGDQGFWNEAHAYFYERFRETLPLRLKE